MTTLLAFFVFVVALVGMEGVAWLTHRYLMHGPLWVLHQSHHRPGASRLQRNDAFAVLFSLPSIALIYLGTQGRPLALAAGLGMAAYGVLYFLVHDVIVHRRLRFPFALGSGYLRRIVRAHLVHHRTDRREDAVNFGFLIPPRGY
jgi:beta-carotene 3-hydroxylase